MVKKKPQRTCIVCKNETEKRVLVRIVKTPDGLIEVDLTGKKSGRGAYVCKDKECVSKLKKGKFLNRSFKMEINDETYDKLIGDLNVIE